MCAWMMLVGSAASLEACYGVGLHWLTDIAMTDCLTPCLATATIAESPCLVSACWVDHWVDVES